MNVLPIPGPGRCAASPFAPREETIRCKAAEARRARGCLSSRQRRAAWRDGPALDKLYEKGRFLSRAYTNAKVRAVQQRKKDYDVVWARVKECLDPLVALAGELKVRLGFEIREVFEEFPHEEGKFPGVLDAFPSEVVGYWHDFGHAARKEFLGWHSHEETLRLRAPRLLGCHIHDCRRPDHDHLPLSHGEIDFATLLPILPQNAIATLELSPSTLEEQVIASRHLWNSYVAASA